MNNRITLALIVRNESYFLPAFLARHIPHFDEVVAVDTGSTDNTISLLANAGAHVLPFPWQNDFAAARNHGLAASTGDWIMVLDPDEFIAETDLADFRTLLSPDPPVDAFWFYTRNYSRRRVPLPVSDHFDEQQAAPHVGPAFDSRKIRLFRRLPDFRFEGQVHEIISVGKLQSKRYRVLPSHVLIHHYTSFRNVQQRTSKSHSYLSIGLRKLCNEVTTPAQFELALAYLSVGNYDLAAVHFEEGVRHHGSLVDELGRVIGRETAAQWQNHVLKTWVAEARSRVSLDDKQRFEQDVLVKRMVGK